MAQWDKVNHKLQKPAFVQEKSSFWLACSGGCRASDKEGRGHPDSKMGWGGGAVSKKPNPNPNPKK